MSRTWGLLTILLSLRCETDSSSVKWMSPRWMMAASIENNCDTSFKKGWQLGIFLQLDMSVIWKNWTPEMIVLHRSTVLWVSKSQHTLKKTYRSEGRPSFKFTLLHGQVLFTSWLKPMMSKHLWTSSNLRLFPRVHTKSWRFRPPVWR